MAAPTAGASRTAPPKSRAGTGWISISRCQSPRTRWIQRPEVHQNSGLQSGRPQPPALTLSRGRIKSCLGIGRAAGAGCPASGGNRPTCDEHGLSASQAVSYIFTMAYGHNAEGPTPAGCIPRPSVNATAVEVGGGSLAVVPGRGCPHSRNEGTLPKAVRFDDLGWASRPAPVSTSTRTSCLDAL
jgi:hypothetical protein